MHLICKEKNFVVQSKFADKMSYLFSLVCCLWYAIFNLKQDLCAWPDRFNHMNLETNFTTIIVTTLYLYAIALKILLFLLNVWDIKITSDNYGTIWLLKAHLQHQFKVKVRISPTNLLILRLCTLYGSLVSW